MNIEDIFSTWITNANPFMSDEDKHGWSEYVENRSDHEYAADVQNRIREMDRAANRDHADTALAIRTAKYEIDKIANSQARTDAGMAVNKARRTRW